MSVRWTDCLFGHDWTKWANSGSGEITRTGERESEVVGFSVFQKRECEVCGKVQYRAEKTWTV